jgi:hypothetical protein
MGMNSNVTPIPAPPVAGPEAHRGVVRPAAHGAVEHRESMLGEWIGVSLERFLDVTGQRAGHGDRGVTVLAAEVPPRRRAPLPGQFDSPWSRTRERAAGVTIVKWRVHADEVAQPSDNGARFVR